MSGCRGEVETVERPLPYVGGQCVCVCVLGCVLACVCVWRRCDYEADVYVDYVTTEAL